MKVVLVMRLGANLAPQHAVDLAVAAEQLRFEMVLASEGHRSDAVSVLGLVAGRTHRIQLCSGVMQIPGRPPGMAALTAATLDALSGGRFRLGLGVSNPHVSDGWYGVPFDRPLERTREYVDIVRRAMDGGPVRYQGRHFRLPAGDSAAAPLHVRTERTPGQVPVYLGAVGVRSLHLTGEIADGWLGGYITPELVAKSVAEIRGARERVGKDMSGFDVIPFVALSADPDPEAAAGPLRAHYAHLMAIGGEDNFYCAMARGLGFDREMDAFQERVAAGDVAGAAAAVPLAFIDRTALIGPLDRIAARMREYAEAGVTTLSILASANDTDAAGRVRVLADAAEALRLAGLDG